MIKMLNNLNICVETEKFKCVWLYSESDGMSNGSVDFKSGIKFHYTDLDEFISFVKFNTRDELFKIKFSRVVPKSYSYFPVNEQETLSIVSNLMPKHTNYFNSGDWYWFRPPTNFEEIIDKLK